MKNETEKKEKREWRKGEEEEERKREKEKGEKRRGRTKILCNFRLDASKAKTSESRIRSSAMCHNNVSASTLSTSAVTMEVRVLLPPYNFSRLSLYLSFSLLLLSENP